MSDQRAGWLLVIVSGALAIVVCLLAYAQVGSQGILEGSSNAGQAAIDLLLAALPGILMVVALDVIAFFVSKDLRVRIVAAAVAVLTIVGVLVAGAIGAERTDPPASAYWAAAGDSPGPFDCAALNSDTPAEMQAALDELDHGLVEIYFAADDSCAAMLPGVTPAEAIGSYLPQLEAAGWRIEQSSPEWLEASRGGYQLWVVTCFPDSTQAAVGIFEADDLFWMDCDNTQP